LAGIWQNTPTLPGRSLIPCPTAPSSVLKRQRPCHLHVRGVQERMSVDEAAERGTPPSVEFSQPPPCLSPSASEHLHVRGVQSQVPTELASATGAPPRAWSSVLADRDATEGVRSTSTCVEFRLSPSRMTSSLAEHLHVRGVQSRPRSKAKRPGRAPPRAWSSEVIRPRERVAARSTSTCVEFRVALCPQRAG
jgi:hypothetical protein